jgi:hypothetical protein
LARDPIPDHERVYAAVAKRDATGARDAMTSLIRLALLDTTRNNKKPATPVGAAKRGAPKGGKPHRDPIKRRPRHKARA